MSIYHYSSKKGSDSLYIKIEIYMKYPHLIYSIFLIKKH